MKSLNSLIEIHIQGVPKEVTLDLMPSLAAYCHIFHFVPIKVQEVITFDEREQSETKSLALFITGHAKILVIPSSYDEARLVILADTPKELSSFRELFQCFITFRNYPEEYNQIMEAIKVADDSFKRENVEKRLLTANPN